MAVPLGVLVRPGGAGGGGSNDTLLRVLLICEWVDGSMQAESSSGARSEITGKSGSAVRERLITGYFIPDCSDGRGPGSGTTRSI